jgi:hypothetical protein
MNLVTFPPHSDTLGAHENYSVLTDQADEADIRRRAEEDAGVRTRPARKEIAALATNLTELELGALVSSLIGAVAKCGWSHTTTGKTVTEYLLDVQEAIERGCE